MTLETLREFFGWCLLLNAALLVFMTLALGFLGAKVARLHGKILRVAPQALPLEFYRFLGAYKLAVLLFNAVPYVALSLMG